MCQIGLTRECKKLLMSVSYVCLQVNDVQLYGKTRREVVSFLKEVPPPFTLVCCRHPTSDLEPELESETESEREVAPVPIPVAGPVSGPGAGQQPEPSMEEVRMLKNVPSHVAEHVKGIYSHN